ncbi:hypothetical protein QG37_07968 [Candidozyma auris]|uniref:Uncharacterized protein n=1 Tax=Candidozyma auris TaxID=498019 RepID=A0A0L0NNN3_CANAR|nr:hypothetical protein QG37_07968 [[Candida] auris]
MAKHEWVCLRVVDSHQFSEQQTQLAKQKKKKKW